MSERSVFLAALEIDDPTQRSAYLDRACAGDAELRAGVVQLLHAHQAPGDFLGRPAPDLALTTDQPTCDGPADPETFQEGPDSAVGPYKLLQQIGEGGFGVVYLAEQQQPVRRQVALKVLKPGMDSRQVIARFEAERQALALMDHPHIARVFDAGATPRGRPYFVMELVQGVPITKYCDERRLTLRQRLELMVPVCQAVQHAHQKGIIHRDLKPSNILVAGCDGRPVPKVIDFGVAKAIEGHLTEKTLATGLGAVVGTLQYMSPEQAELTQPDVDTRSDVYSLGVVLYELLTGTTPLQGKRLRKAAMLEVLRLIREEEPPRPSTRLSTTEGSPSIAAQRGLEPKRLGVLVRGELDWMVMKCLEKDRNRRYETANALALDLQRYLADEPVLACPPSAAYRLRKFARRHKGQVLATLAVALVLVGGIIATTWQMLRATNAQAGAETALAAATESERNARDQLFGSLSNQAQARRFSRQMGQRLDSLDALVQAARIRPDGRLRDEAIAAMALPDLRLGPGVHGKAFDGPYRLYAADDQGVLRIRSVADDREIQRIVSGPTRAQALMLSPDGGFVARIDADSTLRVWRVADGHAVLDAQAGLHAEWYTSWGVAFSPDSRQLAVAQQGSILRFNLATGQETNRWRLSAPAHALAFHPDNRQLAVGYDNSTIASVYDATNGTLLTDLPVGAVGTGQVVAWHPDGERLAVAASDPRIQIWDVAAKRRLAMLEGHVQQVTDLTFHPDGDLLASTSWDGVLRLWDSSTGRPLMQVPLMVAPRFSSDGRWLGIAPHGEQDHLLEVVPSREYRTLPSSRGAAQGGYYNGDISPDGRLLALGMDDGVRLWDLSGGRELAFLPLGTVWAALFQPDGRELMATGDGGLQRWPIQDGGEGSRELRLGPRRTVALPVTPTGMACRSPDGRTLAVVGGEVGVLVDMAAETVRMPLLPHPSPCYVALSRDGRWMATGGWLSDRVRLWDAVTGKMVHEWVLGHRAAVFFTPDSRALILSEEAEVSFWDVTTRELLRRIRRDVAHYPGHVVFTTDGGLMALEMAPGVLHLKETATGRTVARLEDPHGDRTAWMAFTPDGTRLVTAALYAKAVHVWDLRAIRARLEAMGLDWDWPAFSPAGKDGDTPPPRYGAPTPRVLVADAAVQDHWGRVLRGQGLLDQGIAAHWEAVRLGPENPVYHYNLGLALEEKGLAVEATAEFRAALRRLADLPPAFRPLVAEDFAARGKPADVLLAYREAFACLHFNHEQYASLGEALARLGLPEEAMGVFREAVRRHPSSLLAHQRLGVALESKGCTEEAIAVYREGLRSRPDLPPVLRTVIDKDFARGARPADACEAYRLAISLCFSDQAYNYGSLGAVLARMGLVEEGIAAYREAIQRTPVYPWAHFQLGEALQKKGRTEEAIAAYRESIRHDPNNFTAHVQLAGQLIGAGRLDEAIRLKGDYPWAQQVCGLLQTQGLLDKGVAACREGIRTRPDEVVLHIALVVALERQVKLDEALAAYAEWLRLRPRDVDAWLSRGRLYQRLRQTEQALADFSKATEVAPANVAAWVARGHYQGSLGRWEKAAADFSRVVALDPKNPAGWSARGHAHFQMRQWDKAVDDCTQVIQLTPHDAGAWVSRGAALNNKGEYEKGVADNSRAIELAGGYALAWNNRAWALLRLGKFREARSDLEKTLELEPSPVTLNNLAWLLATCPRPELRDPARAVALAEQAARRVPEDSLVQKTLGVARYRAGDWKGAVAVLARSVERIPGGDATDFFFLAMAHRQLGDKDEARKWYDQAVRWVGKESQSEELRRFRAEAEEVLGLGPTPRKEPPPGPTK